MLIVVPDLKAIKLPGASVTAYRDEGEGYSLYLFPYVGFLLIAVIVVALRISVVSPD